MQFQFDVDVIALPVATGGVHMYTYNPSSAWTVVQNALIVILGIGEYDSGAFPNLIGVSKDYQLFLQTSRIRLFVF